MKRGVTMAGHRLSKTTLVSTRHRIREAASIGLIRLLLLPVGRRSRCMQSAYRARQLCSFRRCSPQACGCELDGNRRDRRAERRHRRRIMRKRDNHLLQHYWIALLEITRDLRYLTRRDPARVFHGYRG